MLIAETLLSWAVTVAPRGHPATIELARAAKAYTENVVKMEKIVKR